MNHDEFEAIYRLYGQPLLFYALSLTHRKEDAEDLVHETMIKAFLSYDGRSDLKRWMFEVNP